MTSVRTSPVSRAATPDPEPMVPPLYWRVLRLHHIRPSGWQRALLVEGMLSVAVVLTLADVASSWTLLALPLASVVVVKAHDVLAGWLPNRRVRTPLPPPRLMDYLPIVGFVAVVLLLNLTLN
jgi:hypothetical protein